jgi:hypothetical protein
MQVGHSGIAEDTAAARGCCLLRDPRGWLRPRVHRGFWLAYSSVAPQLHGALREFWRSMPALFASPAGKGPRAGEAADGAECAAHPPHTYACGWRSWDRQNVESQGNPSQFF